jgi:hypothetical protein
VISGFPSFSPIESGTFPAVVNIETASFEPLNYPLFIYNLALVLYPFRLNI